LNTERERDDETADPEQHPTAVAMSVNDQSHPVNTQQERGHQTDPPGNGLEKLSLAFDGAIVFFTLVLTVVSYFQWKATRDSFEIGQRAWVTAPGADLRPVPVPDTPIMVAIDIQNTGPSPALDVSVTMEIVISDVVPVGPVKRTPDEQTRSRVALARDAKASSYTRSDAPITADQLAAVVDGKLRIFVIGDITYRDIFGHQRQTTYCFYARTDGKIIDKLMNFCSQRNNAR
jgi:hypothetical protein